MRGMWHTRLPTCDLELGFPLYLPSSKPGQDLLSISPITCASRSSLAPLSQPTRPRLTAFCVDGRGGGHGRFVLKRQRHGDRHGCQVGRGARFRGGPRGCGNQELGCGADVPGEAQPCRGVAVREGGSWLALDPGEYIRDQTWK